MPEIIAKAQNFKGFPKDFFFAENMKRGEFGLGNLHKHTTLVDSSTLTQLADVKAFADAVLPDLAVTAIPTSTILDFPVGVVAQDTNGVIYARQMGSSTWTELYKPGHAAAAVGILWDGFNLYYMGTEHIGQGSPYDIRKSSNVGYSDYEGTVSVTNGSTAVVGSGTTFNGAAQGGKRIKIGTTWYTIASITDTTHLTLSSAYTGSTASGVNYQIYTAWNDTWHDCGSALTKYLNLQPFQYEGDIIIPRQGKLSRYNRTDGSFNADADSILNAPSSFYYRAGSGGPNGVLLLLEPIQGNASYLLLWDNRSDRSIAPWIPLRSKVQAVAPYAGGWIVITQREIVYTNGYTARVLSKGFDTKLGENSFAVEPNGIEVVEDRVVIANHIGGYTKKRSGLYVYDIIADSYEYIAPLGTYGYNVTPYAVFMDTNKAMNVSYATTQPARKYLTTLSDAAAPRAYVITKPLAQNGNGKYLGAVRADLVVVEGGDTITGTITAKVARPNRRLWGVQTAKVAGTQTNQITVDGTALSDVQAGDEITVLEGANAGLTRHIASVSGSGTSSEVWTLDTALTANIESGAYISVTPFKLVSAKTVTSQTELRDLFFDCKNRYAGKEWLVKLQFTDFTVPVEVLEVGVIANDKGTRT